MPGGYLSYAIKIGAYFLGLLPEQRVQNSLRKAAAYNSGIRETLASYRMNWECIPKDIPVTHRIYS